MFVAAKTIITPNVGLKGKPKLNSMSENSIISLDRGLKLVQKKKTPNLKLNLSASTYQPVSHSQIKIWSAKIPINGFDASQEFLIVLRVSPFIMKCCWGIKYAKRLLILYATNYQLTLLLSRIYQNISLIELNLLQPKQYQ